MIIGTARSSLSGPVHVLQLERQRPEVPRGNSLGEMVNEKHSSGMKKWYYLVIMLVALPLTYYWYLGIVFNKGVTWVVPGEYLVILLKRIYNVIKRFSECTDRRIIYHWTHRC
ncbi:uncharacterized protein LOC119588986 [Penaeus monodon]|uniref:uncharacterized protein LOC119588986 n=1 Tax=Penaeus monodon TaxID=6687 RepID=UPI0018A78DB3|nr:uncharacterized protein LOC119588986 [Penaeus monodon]